MAKDSDRLAGTLGTEKTGGVLSGLFAEENEFDRRALWRIGSWGVVTVAAVTVAVMVNQSSLGWRREQVAAADLARQTQQIQSLARESQNETRRLASAIETLNGDRDRLYSRVTVLEQGLDSVTGAIARQSSPPAQPPTPAPQPTPAAAVTPAPASPPAATVAKAPGSGAPATAPSPTTSMASTGAAPDPQAAPKAQANAAPAVAPVATIAPATADKPHPDAAKPDQTAVAAPPPAQTTPDPRSPVSAPLIAAKSMMGPPDPAAAKLIEPQKAATAFAVPASAAAPVAPPLDAATPDPAKPDAAPPVAPEASVHRTEFAVELGSANSVGGLRALWRGLSKSNAQLAELRPIIMIKESHTGLGMQLRLAAGPLKDAATAAKICATLTETQRACETTVFDGQRLAMGAEQGHEALPAVKPAPEAKPAYYRHGAAKHSKKEDPPPAPPKQESSTFSSLFGIKR